MNPRVRVDAHEPADVAGCFTEDAILGVHLSVIATRTGDGWRLAHYQVSYLA